MVAKPGGEPAFDLGVLVGAVVVDDEVDVATGGDVGVDVPEEAQELLVAVPRFALGEDLACATSRVANRVVVPWRA